MLNYYQLGEPEKARAVFEEVATIYQQYLKYYSGLELSRQYGIADEVISNMERYRSLIDIVIIFDEEDYGRAKASEFNSYLKLFRQFYGDEQIDEPGGPTEAEAELFDGLMDSTQNDTSN